MSMRNDYKIWLGMILVPLLTSCTRATVQGTDAAFQGLSANYTFPTTSVNKASTLPLTIYNGGQTNAISITSSFQGSSFSMSNGPWPGAGGTCGTVLPAGGTCTAVMQFLPSVGGLTTGNITVTFFDGTKNTTLTSTLNGTAIPEGTLDTTFGSSGIAQYDFGYNENVSSVNMQADGKIVLYGSTNDSSSHEDAMAVRLLTTGALDTSYGTNGLKTISQSSGLSNDYGYGSVIDPSSGDLTGVGSSAIAPLGSHIEIVSGTANGTLNTSFGIGGISILSPLDVGSTDIGYGIAALGDGRSYIVGTSTLAGLGSTFFVSRMGTNGLIDLSTPTFGVAGTAIMANFGVLSTDVAYAVGIQSNGYVLAVGSSLTGGYLHSAMARLTATGTADTTFGTSGQVMVDMCGYASASEIEDVTFDQNEQILVAGYCTNPAGNKDVFMARFSYIGGGLDTTFGTSGLVRIDVAGHDDVAYKILVETNNQIIVGGYSNNGTVDQFLLIELNADGSRNTSFGTNGVVTTTLTGNSRAHGMTLQSDGKVVLAGYSTGSTTNIAVARYYP